MDDIARAAGVGRTTVFRRFDSKDRLVEIVLLRVVGQATKRVQAVFESARDLETGLTDALVAAVKELRDHPLFAKVLRIEPESFLRMLTTDGASVIAVVRGSIADWLGASGGGAPPGGGGGEGGGGGQRRRATQRRGRRDGGGGDYAPGRVADPHTRGPDPARQRQGLARVRCALPRSWHRATRSVVEATTNTSRFRRKE